ncbi:hypothetical protein [Bacillus paramycoides]|uniref:hypothetical protein n=1 Tax=Bacillus paramycoides TaxID=2026194 RepID=UPI002E23CA89|nr:hypothetical protein [Bacillus paramycoides]
MGDCCGASKGVTSDIVCPLCKTKGKQVKLITLKVKLWPKDTIAADRRHTVGLKSDSTVTAVGDNKVVKKM